MLPAPRITTFFPNETDDLHCLQSCVRMIAAANGITLGVEDAERLSGFVAGLASWPYRMFSSWARMGFEVVQIENFEIEKFVGDTDHYLTQVYGADLHRGFREISDIAQAVTDAANCLSDPSIRFVYRAPSDLSVCPSYLC